MPVIEQIHKHRSIRKYKPDPIPDTLLQELLEAGIRCPSSGNMQAFSIVVTKDAALRSQLLAPHLNQSMVVDAPVLMTFCADFHRMRRWLAMSNAPDNFDNFFSFMIAAIDAILAAQTVALAAESRGLGLCYLGSTLANADQIGKILNLPENVFPVVGYSLGYPAEDPSLRDRLPLKGLIHDETYQQYSDDDIQAIYQEREIQGWQRYMGSEWLRNQVEAKSVENLAQLYTRVKYTRPSYQEISNRLISYLTQQEYMNQGTPTES